MPVLAAQTRLVIQLIQRTIRDCQADAGAAFTQEAPLLRVVSSLAEGADRLVANEALALGFELEAPLPFDREAYADDFEGTESQVEYRDLLAKARVVLELDGSRRTEEGRARSYEAAGRMVLRQSDLLIALWDGNRARGTGGTAQIVREALELGIPTVWIHVKPPHETRVVGLGTDGRLQTPGLETLAPRMLGLLLPPNETDGDGGHRSTDRPLEAYFRERQPRASWFGWAWGVFSSAVADLRPRRPRFRVEEFQAATEREWRREWGVSPELPRRVTGQIDRSIRHHYAWADKLAIHYANLYRSSFVLNYFLGVIAVLLDLLVDLPGVIPEKWWLRVLMRAGALACLLSILVIWSRAHLGRWHERWIDYRLLGELFRQLRFLSLLGRVPTFTRLPAHSAYGNPRNSWLNWYLGATARAAGMLDVAFTPSYLESTRVLLRESLVGEQAEYHRANAERLARMERRLRRLGGATFIGALPLLVWLFLLTLLHGPELAWVALPTAILPVLGGALAAIRGQGELERVVKRSRAMSQQLEIISDQLAEQDPIASSSALARVAEAAAQSMISEVLDWRIVFQDRPLELTG